MHTIIQDNIDNKGRVTAYVDGFIVLEKSGTVKYLSMFGTTTAVKALSAQIIANRDGIHLLDDTGEFVLQEGYRPLEIKRDDGAIRSFTRSVRPGVTHKILFAWGDFMPWKNPGAREFIAFGPTDASARKRVFHIVDKLSEAPLMASWTDWLWDQLAMDAVSPIMGGSVPELLHCRMIPMPDEAWLEERILQDLAILKSA